MGYRCDNANPYFQAVTPYFQAVTRLDFRKALGRQASVAGRDPLFLGRDWTSATAIPQIGRSASAYQPPFPPEGLRAGASNCGRPHAAAVSPRFHSGDSRTKYRTASAWWH